MRLTAVACGVGFVGVLVGAFGAHGLKEHFASHAGARDWYQTAVQYHLLHAVMMFLAARSAAQGVRFASSASVSFLVGVLLFSGSLYLLALTGTRAWGAVTPFGGVAFLVGWALLGVGCLKQERS